MCVCVCGAAAIRREARGERRLRMLRCVCWTTTPYIYVRMYVCVYMRALSHVHRAARACMSIFHSINGYCYHDFHTTLINNVSFTHPSK